MLTVDNLANLLSWPAAGLAFLYAAWTWRRYYHRIEVLPHALTATLVAVAAMGFLLRPFSSLGVLLDDERDVAALVIRTTFLIVMAGLVWHLIDKWRETRP